MAKVNLVLKEPNSDKETRVCAILTNGRKIRFKFYSKVSVKPKHWSKTAKKVLSANPNAIEYNKTLTNLSHRLINIYNDAVEKGLIPTTDYIKEELEPKIVATSKNKEFWAIWDKYLEAQKSNFKPKSFEKFGNLKKHLEEFEKKDKLSLQLEAINANTLSRLQTYFFDVLKLRTSTTSKYIDNFKSFLNWTNKHEYSSNMSFKGFKPQRQPDTLKVILTSSEIEKIENTDLKHDYLKNARELLILSTLTGLRYSDYSRISQEHISTDKDGNSILKIRQGKTRDYVQIPLVPQAVSIINKLLKGELRAITNQKLNSYIKKVCEVAKIDDKHETFIDRGKLSISKKVPKYELISTHTGRRTFATNLLLKGIPPEVVMRYTGHKDYKSFKNYVNIPKQAEFDLVKSALLA